MKKPKSSSVSESDQNPIGFLSYVRFDDQHENGRLTEFCKRLSGEVRVQTGEKFHIFQDRNDIGWGQQWQERIDGSLDAVTFLIPIVTPSFFKSVACRDELERFLNREKRLKRDDLILPVYYVNSPLLNDEEKRKGDKLAKIIGARQHADWRELRFEPFTSPQVGKTLAKMATQIGEALERGQPRKLATLKTHSQRKVVSKRTKSAKPRHVPTRARSEELRPSASAAEHSRVESAHNELTRGPSSKTEPPTLVVDALHRGDYPTLTAALSAAKPGHRILVRAGLYQEGVVIDKPVEIIGDGELGDVVIEATEKNTVLFKASMGRIANLTLRQTGGDKNFYCVDITQGRLDLEGCDITSQGLACVAIHGGADPRLRRNRIHDGKGGGVVVYENGQGTLEDNDIFANEFPGVSIKTGANPTVRRNRIHEGKSAGVLIYEKGQGILEDNDIFANALAGIEIIEESNPTVRRNLIHDGKGSGVKVIKGKGTIEDNEIFANALGGVLIASDGNPTVRSNRIHDGKQCGMLIFESGQGVIENNDIFANAFSGVEVRQSGNPTLRLNRITKNGTVGAYIHDNGGGVFEENDLRENFKGAWSISVDSKEKVKRKGNREKESATA